MTGNSETATITRRTLLLASAGAAATAAIPEVASAASKRFSERFRPHLLRSTYEPLVGQDFTVGGWAGSTTLRLVAVEDIPNLSGQTADFRERSFVLLFQGPADAPLEAGMYRFKHKRTGRCDLTISSSSLGWGVQDYAVVLANAKRRAKKPKGFRRRRKKTRRA